MIPLKKGQPREDDRYMWGWGGGGRPPHPHIYPSPLLEGNSLVLDADELRIGFRVSEHPFFLSDMSEM